METIPEDIQRFILRSIDSIPHLEAILLLRFDPAKEWDAKMVSQNLYISEKKASQVLKDLCNSGFIALKEGSKLLYFYHPISKELKQTLDKLTEIYTTHLIEVTNLIHSNSTRQAQTFGDAFKWNKEEENP